MPLATDRARGLLGFARHPHDRERSAIAREIPIKTRTERRGVAPVGLHAFSVSAPVSWPDDEVMHPKLGQLAMQHIAEWARFITSMHHRRGHRLAPGERRKLLRRESLRRLWHLRVDLPHHHNRAGVNVQPELDYSGASAGHCLDIRF